MSWRDEPLDSGSIADIPKSKALFEQLRQFHWEYYSHLAYLRDKIYDSLKNSLRERSKQFQMMRWQRVVKYKYALDPLGVAGSIKNPGGRFNIGAIDVTRYPVFPALYVASDKGTALAELLGRTGESNSLTAEEIALAKPDSITTVSVSGQFEAVLDITDENNLAPFTALIKDFRLSPSLSVKAQRLNFPLGLIKTTQTLATVLQAQDWRNWPTLFDVPNASQIFGRIVFDAQIEGIIYKSVLTQKPCLAIYSQNFRNSSSYIQLDDPTPPGVTLIRLDSSNCKDSA